MPNPPRVPDYDLDDRAVVSSHDELRALFHDFRGTLVDLLLERAATVGELATATGRPKSTVAYHVGVLVEAGIVKIVRTRRVRAIEERFYGRTARIFTVGSVTPDALPLITNHLVTAAGESLPAHDADDLRAVLRHTRMPEAAAKRFWRRVLALVAEFSEAPRDGETVFGFVAGLYPTEHPTLPPPSGTESP